MLPVDDGLLVKIKEDFSPCRAVQSLKERVIDFLNPTAK
jgi:hypothetical protein